MDCPNCDAAYLPGMTGGACPFCGHEPGGEAAEDAGFDIQSVDVDDFPRSKTVREGTHAGKSYHVELNAITPIYGWGHYTAYVETELASTYEWDELSRGLRAHGGITYAIGDEVGFDTNHAFDVNVDDDGEPLPGDMNSRMGFADRDGGVMPSITWSPDDVEAEVKRLCEEVARVEEEVGAVWETPDGESESAPGNDDEPVTDGGCDRCPPVGMTWYEGKEWTCPYCETTWRGNSLETNGPLLEPVGGKP